MQEKRDSEGGSRKNRDCYQHNDDKPIFFAHRSRPPQNQGLGHTAMTPVTAAMMLATAATTPINMPITANRRFV
jgi:hypothetical protein